MSAETSNNVVTVSHPARVCSIALPRVLIAVLVVRVGEPLGSARGGWLTKLIFDVEEGYEGFRDKYHGLFAEDDRAIYLKTTKHGGQSKYVRHSNDHIRGALQHRWRLATLSDKRSSFHFDAFLYVQNATQPPSQFQRATAGRIERARAQRMAYESTSAVSFEPITAHHPGIVNARRPDSAPSSSRRQHYRSGDRTRQATGTSHAQRASTGFRSRLTDPACGMPLVSRTITSSLPVFSAHFHLHRQVTHSNKTCTTCKQRMTRRATMNCDGAYAIKDVH
ncbi:hypothetical protein JG687_00012800 [Phytophthora cactorum]|uniref:Uncharacterized protein n=1 Tax=Phytophthora cactorum TaxID=29920 RepID=A0A8T1U109_9STRA|nr:hypothetical protein JG687_00012800 [Phytophthora cactorum]